MSKKKVELTEKEIEELLIGWDESATVEEVAKAEAKNYWDGKNWRDENGELLYPGNEND